MSSTRPFKIAGSILGGDPLNLQQAIGACERAGVDLHQLDVCDGVFVPTISFGEEVVRRTCEVASVPVEVHLMVARPEDWLRRMEGMGQFRMIFHLEASQRSMGLVQSIHRLKWEAGIALNPETPPGAVEPFLDVVENVCVMGIAPGFAGQTMLDYTYRKVADIRGLIDDAGAATTVTVDGGVKQSNARRLVEAGADILVVSSGIFAHPRPEQSVAGIRNAVSASSTPVT
jgi:ribulose-phosphate 3-epimerase